VGLFAWFWLKQQHRSLITVAGVVLQCFSVLSNLNVVEYKNIFHDCDRFYAAEVVIALEYLHCQGIYTHHTACSYLILCTPSIPRRLSEICQNLDVSRHNLYGTFLGRREYMKNSESLLDYPACEYYLLLIMSTFRMQAFSKYLALVACQ
jgi:hypothetical protein